MKQTILSFFILMSGTAFLHAQISLDASYFPAAGDTLKTIVAESTVGVAITANGGDQTWDFSQVADGFERVRIVGEASEGQGANDFPNAEIQLPQFTGAEGYYNVTENEFSVIGYFGEDPLGQGIQVSTPFNPAYVERWAPLNFFDLNSHTSALTFAVAVADIPGGIFDGLPISPDSIRVKVNTSRTDLVNGWGMLMIPGGSYEVLRERREEFREIRLEAKLGALPWWDITDIALGLLPIDELGSDTLITYSFWSAEAKEPIMLITADANEEITAVEYKSIEIVSSADDPIAPKESLIAYPNPTMGNVRFEVANLKADHYELAIFNLTGKTVWSKQYAISGHQKIDLNLGHFPKGYYIYTLSDSRGNRVAVNRLMIMKP